MKKRYLILIAATASACLGQSLEDKVSQSRKMQAESMYNLDPGMLDSIQAERKSSLSKIPRRSAPSPDSALDSLLAGPLDPDSLYSYDSLPNDSARRALPDSTRRRLGRYRRMPPLPKRYEQRIFTSSDRSLFASAVGATGRDYVLRPGDEVSLALWGDREKEYSLTLNREGKAFIEGIGQVQLSGQSLDGAQKTLVQRMSKIYSGFSRGTTHLDVSLGKTGPMRVFVLGNVKSPGGFVLSGQSNMLAAMYFAKGPTDIGTVRNLVLTRSGNKYDIDLYQYLMRGESPSPGILQDGDVLFSGRAEALVEVSGDVGRPATYELKKGEGVKEALAFAGGINATAAPHKLTLRRIFENGRPDYVDLAPPADYLNDKAKMELRDGDQLSVVRSTELSQNFLTISGPVKYPGTYEATGIRDVPQLIAKAGGLRDDAYLGRVHVVRFFPNGSSSLMAYSLDRTSLDSITLRPKDNVILYSIKDMYIPDSVQIAGAVFNPGKYEFREGMAVKDLIMQAGGFLPHHEQGKVLVFRGSAHKPTVDAVDLQIEDGLAKSEKTFFLQSNDFVQVPVDPQWYRKEIVSLEGLFYHPGKYALLYPGEKLSSVIKRAGGFKENAYVEGAHFFRSKDSVGRVGVDIREAVDHPRGKMNIALVNGDSIFIPERLNTVKVIGEVGFETSVLYKEGATAQYYIEHAGGFTRRSEKDRVVVQYANGESSREGYFNRKPDAGSVIYVPQGPEPKPFDFVAGLNATLGTLGVAAALLLSIQAISRN